MVNRKKILYLITKSVWGGAGKYVYDLARVASERGFDATVAAGGKEELAQKLKEKNIRYFDVAGLQRDIAFLKPFISGLVLLKILIKFKPDVVHANSPQAAGIGGVAVFLYQLFSLRKVKKIFTVHGWSYHEARPLWQNFLIRFFSKTTCLFYQKIICVSEYDRLSALKHKIAPAHKLITIHNGISPDSTNFFFREEAREKLNTVINYGINYGILAGTIGEFTKNKGQKYLIDAIKILNAKRHTLNAVLIGWGEEKKNLEYRILNLELNNNIFLTENLSPASPYLKAFDIFVLPSLKEGLPYTLLEAGLAEIPVIATSVGGVPEIIENGHTGLLVPPANPQALADSIERLMKDENLRKNLAHNLHQKILRDFSAREMLERTFTVY